MGLLFNILKCSGPGWLYGQLVSFKVVIYCVWASAATQCSCSAGTPWEPGWAAGLLMGFRGDNRAGPGNSRSGRKAGLRARENLLGGGGARHSVQFPQPLLAGTLAHSVGLTHGPAPTPQACGSLHKYFFFFPWCLAWVCGCCCLCSHEWIGNLGGPLPIRWANCKQLRVY